MRELKIGQEVHDMHEGEPTPVQWAEIVGNYDEELVVEHVRLASWARSSLILRYILKGHGVKEVLYTNKMLVYVGTDGTGMGLVFAYSYDNNIFGMMMVRPNR